jgi:hypothetical protein
MDRPSDGTQRPGGAGPTSTRRVRGAAAFEPHPAGIRCHGRSRPRRGPAVDLPGDRWRCERSSIALLPCPCGPSAAPDTRDDRVRAIRSSGSGGPVRPHGRGRPTMGGCQPFRRPGQSPEEPLAKCGADLVSIDLPIVPDIISVGLPGLRSVHRTGAAEEDGIRYPSWDTASLPGPPPTSCRLPPRIPGIPCRQVRRA